MLKTLKISPKGQIAIPKKFRDKLELRESTEIYLTESNGKLIIGKVEDIIPKTELKNWPDTAKLAAFSLKDIWDNDDEEKVWSKYK